MTIHGRLSTNRNRVFRGHVTSINDFDQSELSITHVPYYITIYYCWIYKKSLQIKIRKHKSQETKKFAQVKVCVFFRNSYLCFHVHFVIKNRIIIEYRIFFMSDLLQGRIRIKVQLKVRIRIRQFSTGS